MKLKRRCDQFSRRPWGAGRTFNSLQPTGAGSRTLTVPTVSSSFSWTAQQVVKLTANKQTVYILANNKLDCKVEVK